MESTIIIIVLISLLAINILTMRFTLDSLNENTLLNKDILDNQTKSIQILSDVSSEQERQRKLANITTSEFVDSFNNLVNNVNETLEIINQTDVSDSQLRTLVSRLQLDSAASVENERTMFEYLDDLRGLIKNHTTP